MTDTTPAWGNLARALRGLKAALVEHAIDSVRALGPERQARRELRRHLLIAIITAAAVLALFWANRAEGRGRFKTAPTEPQLAAVFQAMADGYLGRADVGDDRRAEFRAQYYSDAEAALFARAVFHGLEQNGVDPAVSPSYVALVAATVFQQSSGKRDALSYSDPTEPRGEDVGWYQVRLSVVFRDAGCWDQAYPDRPKPETKAERTTAMLDPMTAAPIWVCHLRRQERSCGTWLRKTTARKLTTAAGGPLRYCRAVWFEDTEPTTVRLAGFEVTIPGRRERREGSRTRRCWIVRHAFGVPTYNMGATNVAIWGRRYRDALDRVLMGGDS